MDLAMDDVSALERRGEESGRGVRGQYGRLSTTRREEIARSSMGGGAKELWLFVMAGFSRAGGFRLAAARDEVGVLSTGKRKTGQIISF
jgi:hypothetical protein